MSSRSNEAPDVLRRAAMSAPILAADEERECLRRVQEEDNAAAMDTLLKSHLRMVLAAARRYAKHGVPIEDLISEGSLGLLEAARRFDRTRDNRFSTYAAWWVRAFIRRHAFANRRIVKPPTTRSARRLLGVWHQTERKLTQQLGTPPTREQLAEELGVAADDVAMMEVAWGTGDVRLGHGRDDSGPGFEPAGGKCPERSVQRRQLVEQFAASLEQVLEPRERMIVERHLLNANPETLAAIGSSIGLSRERVRQLEKRARTKLRTALLEHVA